MKLPHQLRGQITDHPIFSESTAREYLRFLQRVEPLDAWADVKPRETPVIAEPEAYEYDEHTVERLIHLSPALSGAVDSILCHNKAANVVGFRYALTRCVQHASILLALEEIFSARSRKPSLVIDVGCFTGGLIHYLASKWEDIPCVGFDVVPLALDVCHAIESELQLKNSPHWLEANFALVTPDMLPDEIRNGIRGGVVILSNVIEYIGNTLAPTEVIDGWYAKGRLISYWVNQGACVILCGAHEDPDCLRDTLVQAGSWEQKGCTANLLFDFESPTTSDMTDELPLGSWEVARSHVIAFLPPAWRLTR